MLPVVPVRPRRIEDYADEPVNAVHRLADVVVQKWLREGFGLVVSEAVWKGKPVVGGNVGGIRLTGRAARGVGRERFLTTRELEDHLQLLGRLAP